MTLAVWGWPVWQAFFDALPLTRTIAFEAGSTGFEKFQSIFAWVRLWGGSVAFAYAAQALVTAASVVACVWIWRSDTSLRLKGAALLTGAMLSSPYVLDYDFVVFGMALAFLAAHALEHGFERWEKTLIAVAWFTPLCARALAQTILLPIGFLTLAACSCGSSPGCGRSGSALPPSAKSGNISRGEARTPRSARLLRALRRNVIWHAIWRCAPAPAHG